MAIIWSHRENGHLYQVRGAGASLRLYTDGVLHSQFNPRRVVTGSVWDLLWLPLFFRSSPAPDRVLLLGMGAGTAVRATCSSGSATNMPLEGGVQVATVHGDHTARHVG